MASADSPRIAEPPARPLLSESKGGDDLSALDVISDLFEAAGNLRAGQITAVEAAAVLVNVIGDDPPSWLQDYFRKPATNLIPVATAVGHTVVVDQLNEDGGTAWYNEVLACLLKHYQPTEASVPVGDNQQTSQ